MKFFIEIPEPNIVLLTEMDYMRTVAAQLARTDYQSDLLRIQSKESPALCKLLEGLRE